MGSTEYKLVTTMWVLSCTDIPPQMTYKSISERLENGDEALARKLVSRFPELFQQPIPKSHLIDWKKTMKEGKSRPKWIAQSPDQNYTISELSLNDVFRNRFRNSPDAEQLNQELLKWGLDYLGEHFSIRIESSRRWWSRIATVVIPLVSLLIAASSVYFASSASERQIRFEQLKLEREMITPNYNVFLNSLHNSLHTGHMTGDKTYIVNELSKSRSALFALSPFIEEGEFDQLKQDLTSFQAYLLNAQLNDSLSGVEQAELADRFAQISMQFSETMKEKIKVVSNSRTP